MSVRSIEAEVSIKSGVQAECSIGREVIVEVHDDVTLESLTVTANGTYTPSEGVDGYDRVIVSVPPTIPEIEALTVTEDGTYQSSGDGYNPVTVNTGVGALRQEIASAETASGCRPLVDGLTALTTYANEVTGQEDTTLSDAVETLASRYGKAEFNPFAYIKNVSNAFNGMELPENAVIDFEGNINPTTYATMFQSLAGCKKLIIKNLNANAPFNSFIFRSKSIEELTFENCILKPTALGYFAAECTNLQAIYGEFDMSSITSNNVYRFIDSANIKEVRFKENTLSVGLTNICSSSGSLSEESLVSIANSLVSSSPNSIQLRSANIAKCNAILGNNVNGTFVADENGSMTLMDFITTVKGWTVT